MCLLSDAEMVIYFARSRFLVKFYRSVSRSSTPLQLYIFLSVLLFPPTLFLWHRASKSPCAEHIYKFRETDVEGIIIESEFEPQRQTGSEREREGEEE